MSVSRKTWAVSGLCAVLSLGLVMLGACNKAPEKAKEKAAEKMLESMIEKSTGKKASVDLSEGKMKFEAEGTKTEFDQKATVWPEDIPSEVPRLSSGKIRHATRSQSLEGMAWSVGFEEVPAGALKGYEEALKTAGFESVSNVSDDGGVISAQKGPLMVSLFVGGGNGQLSVQKQTEQTTD